MAIPSPLLRQRLLRQWIGIHQRREAGFPAYLEAARAAMPDHVSDPRFAFVVLRLWRDEDDDLDEDFAATLPGRYEAFVAEFAWTVESAPAWATEARILNTLGFWQKRHPARLHAKDAVRILQRLQEALSPSVSAR